MTLPRRREKPRSGIERAVKREWPKHRYFVRRHECCVAGRGDLCLGAIEFSHIRSAANAGTGIKPHDASGVSMCWAHHARYHAIGHDTFERQYGIDLAKLAAEFAARSPDIRMKAAMKEAAQAVLARYVAQGGPPRG